VEVAVVRLPLFCVLTTFWRLRVVEVEVEAPATAAEPSTKVEMALRMAVPPPHRLAQRVPSPVIRTMPVAVLVAVAMLLAVQVEH
jgi:hypothetical protein